MLQGLDVIRAVLGCCRPTACCIWAAIGAIPVYRQLLVVTARDVAVFNTWVGDAN